MGLRRAAFTEAGGPARRLSDDPQLHANVERDLAAVEHPADQA
jgi:hypothetical protein